MYEAGDLLCSGLIRRGSEALIFLLGVVALGAVLMWTRRGQFIIGRESCDVIVKARCKAQERPIADAETPSNDGPGPRFFWRPPRGQYLQRSGGSPTRGSPAYASTLIRAGSRHQSTIDDVLEVRRPPAGPGTGIFIGVPSGRAGTAFASSICGETDNSRHPASASAGLSCTYAAVCDPLDPCALCHHASCDDDQHDPSEAQASSYGSHGGKVPLTFASCGSTTPGSVWRQKSLGWTGGDVRS